MKPELHTQILSLRKYQVRYTKTVIGAKPVFMRVLLLRLLRCKARFALSWADYSQTPARL